MFVAGRLHGSAELASGTIALMRASMVCSSCVPSSFISSSLARARVSLSGMILSMIEAIGPISDSNIGKGVLQQCDLCCQITILVRVGKLIYHG